MTTSGSVDATLLRPTGTDGVNNLQFAFRSEPSAPANSPAHNRFAVIKNNVVEWMTPLAKEGWAHVKAGQATTATCPLVVLVTEACNVGEEAYAEQCRVWSQGLMCLKVMLRVDRQYRVRHGQNTLTEQVNIFMKSDKCLLETVCLRAHVHLRLVTLRCVFYDGVKTAFSDATTKVNRCGPAGCIGEDGDGGGHSQRGRGRTLSAPSMMVVSSCAASVLCGC